MAVPEGRAPGDRVPADRAAAVRAALRSLVARNGFHGASMGAVAREAGVATGTAYTHYASKDELVLAAYRETKAALGLAVMAGSERSEQSAESDATGPGLSAEERFRVLWLACYRHLQANPEHAQFLLQVEHSPYRGPAHESALADGNDPLVAQASQPVFAERLLPLPLDVLYELSFSPAVRLAAGGAELSPDQLDEIADACWRAVSRPG